MTDKIFYTIPEVAKYLRKSNVTVRRYIKAKMIKGFYKIGREWRIDNEDLLDFIRRAKIQYK